MKVHHLLLALPLLPGPALAQLAPPSTTEQHLQQLQQADQAAKAAEARNWRTFPKPAPAGGAFNPLAPDSWLQRQLSSYDPSSISCDYNWAGWKLDPATGIRNTEMRCRVGYFRSVAVNCATLQLSTSHINPQPPATGAVAGAFQLRRHWRLPGDEGQRQLVLALCDNLAGSGQEVR